ncbi:phenoloxidase-activating factor 2-like [Colletes gigas]|uniref:phenoloxidase-activating factor 2-like n=1 Tax=Colletes gigas TaxID=935657 RepID=UPI001C9B5F87|nr:phenoloxidase-activating factor 2-like [Colletes gigas]
MSCMLLPLFVVSMLQNQASAQNEILVTFDGTPATASSSSNNGMCTCVPEGTCSSATTNIDIRIVNTGSNCSAGQVYCCSPTSGHLLDTTCGIRKITSSSHTEGQANYGAYPWQAVLLTTSNGYAGSGVLITPNHILTAAHKVASYTNGGIKVRLGERNDQSTSELYPVREYTVRKVAVHPNFNSVNLQNDVAVLTLSGTVPISSSPNINTACFPSAVPPANTRCWVSGWGKDAFGANGKYQSTMKEVDVPIVDDATCEAALRRTRLGQSFSLSKGSFLCAGGEPGKDACTGDGGSPLVCQSGNGQWQVVGLVAWGIGCATQNVPGVYVNVYNYISWIMQQLN